MSPKDEIDLKQTSSSSEPRAPANSGQVRPAQYLKQLIEESLNDEKEVEENGPEAEIDDSVLVSTPEDVANKHWTGLELTGNIHRINSSVFKFTFLTELYLNKNSLTDLPPQIGRLSNLRILDASDNKLHSLPVELCGLAQLTDLDLHNNCLTNLPCEFGQLFNLLILNIKDNPLQSELIKLQQEVNGTTNLVRMLLDALPFPSINIGTASTGNDEKIQKQLCTHFETQKDNVTSRRKSKYQHHGIAHPGPPSNFGAPDNLTQPPRSWISLCIPTFFKPSCIFTVVSYNVLCNRYATKQQYAYCPTWALDWNYRRQLIIAELKKYKTDIICLQEVETDQFYNFFLPELQVKGYIGLFSAKTRAKSMSDADSIYVDGCAIFFKYSKFKLIEECPIEFNELAMDNVDGPDDIMDRVSSKDNIALAALLETRLEAWDDNGIRGSKCTPRRILVCTTHIHWDPKFCDVKLVQTMMLMQELKRIIASKKKTLPSPDVQLLLCGDFNSYPDSGVVQFLQNGRISSKHPDFKDLPYKKFQKMNSETNSKGIIEYIHGYNLNSVYSPDVMPYTNYTFNFRAVIDYIFCSNLNMKPIGLLGPVDPEFIKKYKILGAPHPVIPSDHLPLIVEIEMV